MAEDDHPVAALPTGPAAAALLAAAIGCALLGLCALAADAWRPFAQLLNLWHPTGPLSGVTDLAIVVWLATWFGLSRRWAQREIPLRSVSRAAAVLFGVGLLLTFPPFMDLLQGK